MFHVHKSKKSRLDSGPPSPPHVQAVLGAFRLAFSPTACCHMYGYSNITS